MGRWHNVCVWVLGMGRSGTAVAQLLRQQGANVVVHEQQHDCPEATLLRATGIEVQCGPPPPLEEHVAWLVKNPGIPYHHPLVVEAERRGIPVVTEIEVAATLTEARIIGITGSNGKTTTTTVTHQLLQNAMFPVKLAGNIGIPLSAIIEGTTADEWLVTELSSFQLKGTRTLRVHIAALLNIVPTHLDYHGTMDDYVASKMRIFAHQTEHDHAVLYAHDPRTEHITAHIRGKRWTFSDREPVASGVGVMDGMFTWFDASRGIVQPLMPVAQLAMRGQHNVANAAAAMTMAYVAGVDGTSMPKVLQTFRGVEHRLEWVADVDGVAYYNDSKATNVTATLTTMAAFAQQPIVWIGGGLDRGVPEEAYAPIYALPQLKAIIAIGETSLILERLAQMHRIPCHRVASREREPMMAEAVATARQWATAGDAVLLSPACASWDVYASFEQRGHTFKQRVRIEGERS